MTRHGFIWSLLAMVGLGRPILTSERLQRLARDVRPKHGDQDGLGNVWTSRLYYDTKLVHLKPHPPKIVSALNDTYLVSIDDVIAHIQQNLCFFPDSHSHG